jgi:hypothetical protein
MVANPIMHNVFFAGERKVGHKSIRQNCFPAGSSRLAMNPHAWIA